MGPVKGVAMESVDAALIAMEIGEGERRGQYTVMVMVVVGV